MWYMYRWTGLARSKLRLPDQARSWGSSTTPPSGPVNEPSDGGSFALRPTQAAQV